MEIISSSWEIHDKYIMSHTWICTSASSNSEFCFALIAADRANSASSSWKNNVFQRFFWSCLHKPDSWADGQSLCWFRHSDSSPCRVERPSGEPWSSSDPSWASQQGLHLRSAPTSPGGSSPWTRGHASPYQVIWSVLNNQRPVFGSGDQNRPIRGQYSGHVT